MGRCSYPDTKQLEKKLFFEKAFPDKHKLFPHPNSLLPLAQSRHQNKRRCSWPDMKQPIIREGKTSQHKCKLPNSKCPIPRPYAGINTREDAAGLTQISIQEPKKKKKLLHTNVSLPIPDVSSPGSMQASTQDKMQLARHETAANN